MKKLIWFTLPQLNLLVELKKAANLNNAEVVREGMKLLAAKYGVKHGDIDPIRNRG